MNTTLSKRPWNAPCAPGPLHAIVEIPGSKSETNRALLLAALADGPSAITGAMDARDSRLFHAALRALGVQITALDASPVVVTPPARFTASSQPVDVGLAGNVMRFIPPLAALTATGITAFVGDPHASRRPVAPMLDALRQLGVPVEGDAVPFSITGGHLTGNSATLDSSASSQFVSGLLLAAARFPGGLTLHHHSPTGASVPSRPHLDMTVGMLRERGVRVDEPDADTWVVHPGPIAALDLRVEPDLTNAAAFLAAGVVSGGSVRVPGWPRHTTQGGDEIRDVLTRMGARVERDGDDIVASATGVLHGIDIDLHASSELTPVVAALACIAEGPSTIGGVAHIRGHETDRLAALAAELGALGARIDETDDGLRIEGRGAASLHGGAFATHADHRMAHAGAVVGTAVAGVELDDITCTGKAMPDFPGLWAHMFGAAPSPTDTAAPPHQENR